MTMTQTGWSTFLTSVFSSYLSHTFLLAFLPSFYPYYNNLINNVRPGASRVPRGIKKKKPAPYLKKRGTNLRMGGAQGKKGRSAQKNRARGSLRKRDKTKDKEFKEEARIERNTVQLPE